MSKRTWALVTLLIALVSSAIFLNLWTPPEVAKQQGQDPMDSMPLTEEDMIQRVRKAYDSLGRAGEDLKRRGAEARAESAAEAAR